MTRGRVPVLALTLLLAGLLLAPLFGTLPQWPVTGGSCPLSG